MTESLRSIRPLPKESLRGVDPSKIGKKLPRFEWVDPRSLYVEEAYQRDLSGNSTALVRKIVAKFNWSRFKPPICVRLPESGNVLVCIDGQHTAMGAASHPDVDKIPVMVVDAADVAARASAFVGHNKDRLALTQMAIFHAELASGDALAMTIDRACKAAGAVILNKPVNLKNPLPAGQTIAVGTIRSIAKKNGEAFLTRVLRVMVRAGRGPVKADELAAASLILGSAADERDIDRRLADVVAEKTAEKWAATCAAECAESGVTLPSALASAWCRRLGLRLRGPDNRGGARGSARLVAGPAAMIEVEPAREEAPRPAPTVPPRPPSPAKQIAPPPVPRQPPPASRSEPRPTNEPPFEKAGIKVDFAAGRIVRGVEVASLSGDAARLVALLLRVAPAFLEGDDVAAKLWGRAGADVSLRLRALADEVNFAAADLAIEVKQVMKTGWMLAVPASEEVS